MTENDIPDVPGPAPPADAEPSGAEAAGTDRADAPENSDAPAALELLARERDAYLDDLRRERAAFLNHKRWVARERTGWEAAAVSAFVENLLPFLDDLDRALGAVREATDVAALRAGFEMICDRFRETLKTSGVEEIPSTGEPFDPRWHEAVLQLEDADHPAGTVLETTQRGYRLQERLIRPSRVVVSRPPQGAAPAADGGENRPAAPPGSAAEGNASEPDDSTLTEPPEGK